MQRFVRAFSSFLCYLSGWATAPRFPPKAPPALDVLSWGSRGGGSPVEREHRKLLTTSLTRCMRA
eukprot:14298226-Alexandrium_andersonii.AAC.1